jgi:hypothetical protein
MIIGAHSIIYSQRPEADRAFLRDVLAMPNVDVGGGWLIFDLPPAEVAVHPSDANDVHELYLMCDDVEAFVADMSSRGLNCSPVQDQGWGRLTQVTLPGGGKLGVYQPRHARPHVVAVAKAKKPRKRAPSRKKAPARKKKPAKPAKKAKPAKPAKKAKPAKPAKKAKPAKPAKKR